MSSLAEVQLQGVLHPVIQTLLSFHPPEKVWSAVANADCIHAYLAQLGLSVA